MSGIVDALSSGVSMLARPVLQAAGTSGTTPTTQPGGQGQEFGSASTLGFVVLLLFFIGVAFLARSMAKHLKQAQRNLGTEDGAPAEAQYGDDPADHDPADHDPADHDAADHDAADHGLAEHGLADGEPPATDSAVSSPASSSPPNPSSNTSPSNASSSSASGSEPEPPATVPTSAPAASTSAGKAAPDKADA
ncbi:MAG TPA: hypothetical protein VHX38_13825 [Pseudonocardiaceae bacterium]|nr:hypothetical protein [Pseudonocardiaceae bacterium]